MPNPTLATPTRQWSPEQEAIFDWFARTPRTIPAEIANSQNLVVVARAGAAKTTSSIEGINRAPERNILMCAFNKRIQEELSNRLHNPNAEAKTLHALSYTYVRDYWPGIKVARQPSDRADALTQAAISHAHSGNPSISHVAPPEQIARLISKLHTLGREMAPHVGQSNPGNPGNPDADDLATLVNIALTYDCVPDALTQTIPALAPFTVEYIALVACIAMEIAATDETLARKTGIDFADMLYLPVRNGWLSPEYDLVVVDEAQDMTLTQLEIATGVTTQGGRICVVGDDKQAIYGFRGADSQSLSRLENELHAAKLTLTTTYRCGRQIVSLAQKLVPDFQAGPSNPEGEVITATLDGHPIDNPEVACEWLVETCQPEREDFILSRKNAPLAKVAMSFIRANKRVRVQGKDIGAGLKALVTRLTRSSSVNSVPKLLTALETWESKEIARAEAKKRPDLCAVIQDKAETIRVLADSVTGPAELLARIDGLFSDAGRGQVVCSSVHKAKGLEASHVYLLVDTLYPKFAMKTDSGAQEEQNIEYVAITRAINSLTLVGGIA